MLDVLIRVPRTDLRFLGFDLWPYISGAAATSPRAQVILGTGDGEVNGVVWSNGTDLWKRLEGQIGQAGWTAPQSPNATYKTPGGHRCQPACVYKIDEDPHEYHDVINSTDGGIVAEHLLALMTAATATGCVRRLPSTPLPNPRGPFGTILLLRGLMHCKCSGRRPLRCCICVYRAHRFHPTRGPQDPQSCVAAVKKYPQYWGPWVVPTF